MLLPTAAIRRCSPAMASCIQTRKVTRFARCERECPNGTGERSTAYKDSLVLADYLHRVGPIEDEFGLYFREVEEMGTVGAQDAGFSIFPRPPFFC